MEFSFLKSKATRIARTGADIVWRADGLEPATPRRGQAGIYTKNLELAPLLQEVGRRFSSGIGEPHVPTVKGCPRTLTTEGGPKTIR